jgi:aminoglycoside phosphotransferase (APT) family kinase protein
MPYAVDQSGAIFPTPYIVIEYIEGATEFAPSDLTDYIAQFAMTLAQIHRADGSKADLAFLPRQAERYAEKLRNRPARIDDSIDEGRIREVLGAGLPLSQLNDSALLHGDYWPGNLLWEGSKLVAVIDWEDAAVGDPLADLGISRLEILWAFGIEAMFKFTRQYQSMMPTLDFSNLPYWDLYAALRPAFKIAEWAEDDAAQQRMRERHHWFVAQAVEGLEVG